MIAVAVDVSAIPEEPAGAGRYVLELVHHLARRGKVELTLVCRRGDAGRWSSLAQGASVLDVAPAQRPVRLVWEQLAFGRRLRDLRVDVLHSPHYTMPRLPSGSTRPSRVVTVHDMTFFDNPEWHERVKVPVFRRAIRVAAERADAVICVSATTANRLRELYPPQGELYAIPHGVDHERFRPDDPAGTDTARLATLGIRPPFIAFLSTIQPRKDVPSLVRAFDAVAAEHPDVQLVIAGGPGWGEAPAKAAIAASPHRDRIVRTGWLPDDAAPALYRAAAAVAYPALAEGFGLPALEALASGTPLVTTRGTAMEEIAGDAAHLIDAGDVDALAAALRVCLGRGPDVETRCRAGLGIAGRYTWDAAAKAHEDVYLATRGRLGWRG